MSVVSMKQLLEAGVHFGHQTRRWNPKMAPYIFTERNGIYIIDLQKTVKLIDEAYDFLKDVAASGKPILFVGTKKQAQHAIADEARRCGEFYVCERWLGGMLTNHRTIAARIARLNEIEQKLVKNLGGIRDMKGMPGAMFIVDPKKEKIAVHEARILNIPIVGMVDTNCDPDDVDYVIPANDDAIRAVKLISSKMADAVMEGKQGESMDDAEAANAEGAEEGEKSIEEIADAE